MTPDMPVSIGGGGAVAGYPVGILCLRSTHPLLPGNVQHAQSFDMPVLYHVIDLDDPWPLMRGEPQIAAMLSEGVEALARQALRHREQPLGHVRGPPAKSIPRRASRTISAADPTMHMSATLKTAKFGSWIQSTT